MVAIPLQGFGFSECLVDVSWTLPGSLATFSLFSHGLVLGLGVLERICRSLLETLRAFAEACAKLGTARQPESVGAGTPYGSRYPQMREWAVCGASKVILTNTAEEFTSTPVSPSQRGPQWRLHITKWTTRKPTCVRDCGVSCLLSAPKLFLANANTPSTFHPTTHLRSGRLRFVRGAIRS